MEVGKSWLPPSPSTRNSWPSLGPNGSCGEQGGLAEWWLAQVTAETLCMCMSPPARDPAAPFLSCLTGRGLWGASRQLLLGATDGRGPQASLLCLLPSPSLSRPLCLQRKVECPQESGCSHGSLGPGGRAQPPLPGVRWLVDRGARGASPDHPAVLGCSVPASAAAPLDPEASGEWSSLCPGSGQWGM